MGGAKVGLLVSAIALGALMVKSSGNGNGNGNEAEVKGQLGSAWPYIAGAGTEVFGYNVNVWRNETQRWYAYNAFTGIDEVGQFYPGDGLEIYAIESCILNTPTFGEVTVYAGLNTIIW